MENTPTKIAELSLNKFNNSLPKTGKPKANEWTVLSSIAIEKNSTFEVVSLGTGSKCIGKTKMCPTGTVINDSHAEVMCRRAFLRYLYGQLKENSFIFSIDKDTGKFALKPNIKFHFFTTHVPCGDAAIFPKEKYEGIGDVIRIDEDVGELPPVKKRKIDDIFRTGAKCLGNDVAQDLKGDGAAYHVVGAIRTKPGRGDPTASVSCSDKLAKWCHLGIQGTLLMLFLETPIYLSSFTILKETTFSCESLERALFTRVQNVELTEPYHRHKLNIFQVDQKFPYTKVEERMACSSSISWSPTNAENNCLEVVSNGRKQGVTKKHYSSEKCRLKICKLEFFKMFVQKAKEFNIKLDLEDGEIGNLTYEKAKSLNNAYKENWLNLKKQFGAWTYKDPTLLQFLPA